MERKIIKIDRAKCNGCGLCAQACHEGAIGMEGGKAVLLRDDYCDGLGDCLPVCPVDAISFEVREAAAYDEAAVKANMGAENAGGCPGTAARAIGRGKSGKDKPARAGSELRQWPVQIKLVPENAPYFDGADILIAADCTAYAYANIHEDFIKGRVALIGCPKLDEGDYAGKLGRIFKANDVSSVTVLRMEVPCCGGIAAAAKKAVEESGKDIPLNIVTVSTEGSIL